MARDRVRCGIARAAAEILPRLLEGDATARAFTRPWTSSQARKRSCWRGPCRRASHRRWRAKALAAGGSLCSGRQRSYGKFERGDIVRVKDLRKDRALGLVNYSVRIGIRSRARSSAIENCGICYGEEVVHHINMTCRVEEKNAMDIEPFAGMPSRSACGPGSTEQKNRALSEFPLAALHQDEMCKPTAGCCRRATGGVEEAMVSR